jgi:aminopyrrolnitrin oxygenase
MSGLYPAATQKQVFVPRNPACHARTAIYCAAIVPDSAGHTTRPSQSKMTRLLSTPPTVEQFPVYPASWYLFGSARELSRPVSKRMLGRQLVAFRTQSGNISVLDAQCSHLGADLGCGKVIGESIQCPFHNWKYGADGVCHHIPGANQIPAFARQTSYPAVERHGYLFFFNGPTPLFPLPFFLDTTPDDFVAGRLFSYTSDCIWFVNAAHGYDTQHFDAVHDRKLVASPRIDCPHPFARRNRYRAEVLGRTHLDKWLRTFAGRSVEITITNWGGTFVVITGDFDRAHSRFMIVTRPLENGHTLCEGIVFAPRQRNLVSRVLLTPLSLAVRRLFTHGYLKDEASHLQGTHYHAAGLIANDRDMIDFFHWVVALPQSAAEVSTTATFTATREFSHPQRTSPASTNLVSE